MPDVNNLTNQNPETIQREIDQTRSAITEKLEALEEQVRGTVQTAKEKVEETIETVTSSVQDTVESVKETFDLRLQVERHPWPMVGGALIVGFAVGRVMTSAATRHSAGERVSTAPEYTPAAAPSAGLDGRDTFTSFRGTPGWADQFSDEFRQVKGVVIGYALGALRDILKQSLPNLSPHLDRISHTLTQKLGGEPVNEPVLGSSEGCAHRG
jgi:ElaB/YqjD/DUF883 family membrane-anchored ribosome-binding protein